MEAECMCMCRTPVQLLQPSCVCVYGLARGGGGGGWCLTFGGAPPFKPLCWGIGNLQILIKLQI
jgi:hypothetical protein